MNTCRKEWLVVRWHAKDELSQCCWSGDSQFDREHSKNVRETSYCVLLNKFLVLLCGLRQRLLISEIEGFLCRRDPVQKPLNFLFFCLHCCQARLDLLPLLLGPGLNLSRKTGAGNYISHI